MFRTGHAAFILFRRPAVAVRIRLLAETGVYFLFLFGCHTETGVDVLRTLHRFLLFLYQLFQFTCRTDDVDVKKSAHIPHLTDRNIHPAIRKGIHYPKEFAFELCLFYNYVHID